MTDPVAVVTGAGGGIGQALTKRLVAAGYVVAGVGRRPNDLAACAQTLGAQKPRFYPIPIDVRDRTRLMQALSQLGPIQVLVANAGVCRQAAIDDSDADAVWDEVLSINTDGVWNTFRAGVPYLVDGGRAVVVSSGLGKLGRAGYGAYAASKHAVLGLVKCLAKELAPRAITVNAVCPGWVETEMAATDILRSAQRSGVGADVLREQAIAGIPLGRFVQAEEVVNLIMWLVSREASAITGENYNISGGEFCA